MLLQIRAPALQCLPQGHNTCFSAHAFGAEPGFQAPPPAGRRVDAPPPRPPLLVPQSACHRGASLLLHTCLWGGTWFQVPPPTRRGDALPNAPRDSNSCCSAHAFREEASGVWGMLLPRGLSQHPSTIGCALPLGGVPSPPPHPQGLRFVPFREEPGFPRPLFSGRGK